MKVQNSAGSGERPLFVVSSLGSHPDVVDYASHRVQPLINELGYRYAEPYSPPELTYLDSDAYQVNIQLAMDQLGELLPRAARFLIVNAAVSEAGEIRDRVLTGRGGADIHQGNAALWVAQAAVARSLRVPSYAIDLRPVHEDQLVDILSCQMQALDVMDLQGDLSAIPLAL